MTFLFFSYVVNSTKRKEIVQTFVIYTLNKINIDNMDLNFKNILKTKICFFSNETRKEERKEEIDI